MWTNYLKIAFRHLSRHRSYALLNILGLAIGLACALVIFRYVQFELSFDAFHETSDRIYRVQTERVFRGDRSVNPATTALTGPAMTRHFPEITTAARLHLLNVPEAISRDEQLLDGLQGAFADSAFFDVFTFPLAEGRPETALRRPQTIVLTRDLARKLFGAQSPLGETVTVLMGTVEQREYSLTVTGVAEPPPPNSHFGFDFLISFSTLDAVGQLTDRRNFAYSTYIVRKEGADPGRLEAKFAPFARMHLGQRLDEEWFKQTDFQYRLQPLTDIHLSSSDIGFTPRQGSWLYISLFIAIGGIIVGIACINYVNLATARAQQRRQEVGMRKTLGARRSQIAGQFLSEAIVLALAAVPIAFLLVYLADPLARQLYDQPIPPSLTFEPWFLGGALLITLLVGLAAGGYPALYLAGSHPTRLFRPGRGNDGPPGLLRKGLITVQFAISIGLIALTAVIWQQVDYMEHKDLGFQTEGLVTIPLRTNLTDREVEQLRDQLSRQPGVTSASATAGWLPGMSGDANRLSTARTPDGEEIGVQTGAVGPKILETLGLELIAGRGFDGASDAGVVINRNAAEAFGWNPREAVGQQIYVHREFRTVRGVTENFHQAPLRQPIHPLVLRLAAPRPQFPEHSFFSALLVRISPGATREALTGMETAWERLVTGVPFTYHFLEDQIARSYGQERRLGRILTAFAAVAVGLACLGLVGLAAYAARRRTHEIAVRKVVGATAEQIVGLLSRQFAGLLVLGFAVAAPLAWGGARWWLQDFAYRIDLTPGLFLMAGGAVALLAFAAIGWQTLKAALTNPAESLRYE